MHPMHAVEPMDATAKLRLAARTEVLRDLGASEEQTQALLAYNENVFKLSAHDLTLPLRDEPFVEAWTRYAAIAQAAGTIRALEPFLVQLRFPIRAGISQDPTYIHAARQGNFSSSPTAASTADSPTWEGLDLDQPDACHVDLYPTPAGAIATITAETRTDFIRLVQALAKKNEPDLLPASMGALMISGYRNWHRVHQVRQAHNASDARHILADPAVSQDRFILLSKGPYSGVSAQDMQLDDQAWAETSWRIRREHEVCHYFCRRVLGAMRNNIYDEILADYCGILRATGSFRADWLLHFLGLEHAPAYRPGARLENYRGTPPLDNAAFAILQQLVYRAVMNLEASVLNPKASVLNLETSVQNLQRLDRQVRYPNRDWPLAILALSTLHLEELASPSALPLLASTFARLRSRITVHPQPPHQLPKKHQEVMA